MLSPRLLLFITSIVLHLTIYFIFYELPHINFGFDHFGLYEWSTVLIFLIRYKLKKNNMIISNNPWISVVPYLFLLTLGSKYLDVWEYVIFTQIIAMLLLKMIKDN